MTIRPVLERRVCDPIDEIIGPEWLEGDEVLVHSTIKRPLQVNSSTGFVLALTFHQVMRETESFA